MIHNIAQNIRIISGFINETDMISYMNFPAIVGCVVWCQFPVTPCNRTPTVHSKVHSDSDQGVSMRSRGQVS